MLLRALAPLSARISSTMGWLGCGSSDRAPMLGRRRWLASAAVMLGAMAPALNGASVEVADVSFDLVRATHGRWLQVVIEVVARPEAPARFVDRVGVQLDFGYEIPGKSPGRFGFYRAEATAIALESGRASFRFYLPPEIVERDRLASATRYYAVELTIDGVVVPPTRRHFAASLTTAAAAASFRERVIREGSRNRGVLVSQDRSPFAAALGGPAAPTFLQPP